MLVPEMGLRKCGAKFHGDSGPEKPYPTDLNQYRPETHLATGGVWEKEKLWGLGYGSSRYKVPVCNGCLKPSRLGGKKSCGKPLPQP